MILVNKPLSLTPLQAIDRLREIKPEYKNETIGYAGRLDPMADGLLLLLGGDDNKKRKEYERLDKKYDFEVLLGIETDSYDVLGLVTSVYKKKFEIRNLKFEIPRLLNTFVGRQVQPYPPFSAARAQGKPLYYWAREGKIDDVDIPRKTITIHTLKLNDIKKLKLANIVPPIIKRIQSVKGNFRQNKILSQWKDIYSSKPNINIIKLSCTISCASGTYVRSIAHNVGKKLATGALAYSITRTAIGPYTLRDALRL